jgi:hypothetical protein
MLLRLAYLGITNAFALLRLLPGGDRDKDIEILSLRHQLAVLQRQLNGRRVRFEPVDRAWLAVPFDALPRAPGDALYNVLALDGTPLAWSRSHGQEMTWFAGTISAPRSCAGSAEP